MKKKILILIGLVIPLLFLSGCTTNSENECADVVEEFQEMLSMIFPGSQTDVVTLNESDGYIYIVHSENITYKGNVGKSFRFVLDENGAIIAYEMYD